MLKGIPSILTPELLKILMEMGHGDELVIADGNFPRFAHPERVVRLDGHDIPEILDAVLKFMPLDPYVDHPTVFMAVLPDDPYVPEIWPVYQEIGNKYEKKGLRDITINKFDFYDRAKKAYAVVTTSETALYANIILKKGVITE
ncbi:L-fucose mutarotase [Hydrogenoanaerobacterium saccharovorans]|uniref:L-fucose mutarotase n=1 Tax=Hydrogenoanaerobacterium saccharovorans TaxID=474960 RepID=A0A1H7YM89_9FIRM|nr:RbsD/FucU domain-containing protein [Hydrogenoanaerobacterium saccharovorans]RPF49129.1 L-fucose mutarotase [Hydrogenoanaerobacterium saccharovorans]SEM47230.1 L-fucose mutarotase [Hydrogenoanaerobacterium saccharovorans]